MRSGVRAVFSTANYHEGAVGFLHALLLKDWLWETELEKIFVSGSRIDWSSGKVVHFNMGNNKVLGLVNARNQRSGIADQETVLLSQMIRWAATETYWKLLCIPTSSKMTSIVI